MHIHNQAIGGPGVLSEAALFQQAQAGCPDSLSLIAASEGSYLTDID